MQRTLYHGSEKIIEKPQYGFGNIHNDYGLGFYCCTQKKLGKEWASRKNDNGFVNQYTLRDDNFKILDLTKPPYDDVFVWIALLMHNRNISQDLKERCKRELKYLEEHYLIEISNYDVVIGYRADDAYFQFPSAFVRSEITLESLKQIYQAGNLGKQYVLISKRAFDNIKFVKYEKSSAQQKQDYYQRVDNANKLYNDLLEQDKYTKGTRLIDLVRDNE